MSRFFAVGVFVIFCKFSSHGYPDLTPEAITVYRNPEFFKNLNYGPKINYNQKSTEVPKVIGTRGKFKYPGETKNSNPPVSSGFEVNYDNSPEFRHEPRDIFVETTNKSGKRYGPYRKKPHDEDGSESTSDVQKPTREGESEENKNRGSKESVENESGEEPRNFVSTFDENSDEEFRAYEPFLLAGPNFGPSQSTGFVSSTYSQPYPFNRTSPILYEDWKFYTYPKIHANEHIQSDSKIYSEEPPSNSFEDEYSPYNRYDDETEDSSNIFESDEFKNLGADTKHIYKKLLKPQKSLVFKFHSKPKFKKLKFKLKKKHLHNSNWFDEYPFNF